MPCLDAALDGGGDQAVDPEVMAQHLEHLQLGIGRTAVGGGDLAGERIGCLAQRGRERAVDLPQCYVEAILAIQQLGARVADLDDPVLIEVAEYGQIPHDPAHGLQLAVRHPSLGRGDQDHGVDQGRMMVEFLVHLSFRWK